MEYDKMIVKELMDVLPSEAKIVIYNLDTSTYTKYDSEDVTLALEEFGHYTVNLVEADGIDSFEVSVYEVKQIEEAEDK